MDTLSMREHGTKHGGSAPAEESAASGPRPQDARLAIVAEDDPDCAAGLRIELEAAGFTMRMAADGDEALRLHEDGGGASLLVTDMMMPNVDGRELISRIKSRQPELPVIAITGAADASRWLAAARVWGATYLLNKPFPARALREAIQLSVA